MQSLLPPSFSWKTSSFYACFVSNHLFSLIHLTVSPIIASFTLFENTITTILRSFLSFKMHSIPRRLLGAAFFIGLTCVSASPPQAFGYGAQTTGGGSAAPQTPRSISELELWLGDNVPRVIMIDRTFDFSDSQGNATGKGWCGRLSCLSSFRQCKHIHSPWFFASPSSSQSSAHLGRNVVAAIKCSMLETPVRFTSSTSCCSPSGTVDGRACI